MHSRCGTRHPNPSKSRQTHQFQIISLPRGRSFSSFSPISSRLLATPRSCYAPPSIICQRARVHPLLTPLFFFMLLTIRRTAIISESISSSGLNSRTIIVWADDRSSMRLLWLFQTQMLLHMKKKTIFERSKVLLDHYNNFWKLKNDE